jgi:DNA-binding transcriptional MerR regulator
LFVKCLGHSTTELPFEEAVLITFNSSQVVELTGITARQLQWMDERGIVVPTRDGHRRLYSLEDLAEIAVICELRRRGFSLQRVRKVIRFLQKELGRRLVETTATNSEVHLLTDGKNIFLEDSERGVIDILKNSRQPMLTMSLSDAVERVRGDVDGAKPSRAARTTKKAQQSESVRRNRVNAGRADVRRSAVVSSAKRLGRVRQATQSVGG